TFVTAIIYSIAFAFIFAVNRDRRFLSAVGEDMREALNYLIPGIGLIVFYNTFRMEISNYFDLQRLQTAFIYQDLLNVYPPIYNNDLYIFSFLWQLNFTTLFLTIISLINIRKFKNQFTAIASLFLGILALAVFLTGGLYFLGDLRESYFHPGNAEHFAHGSLYIFIRYICYAFVGGLIFSIYKTLKQDILTETITHRTATFDFIFYFSMLLILTAELLTWTVLFGYSDSFKLVTSIFWGIFAVALIVIGIYQNKKHLRVGAIVLFAVTLAKLFLYDIAELGTISKTVVFVSLGILLLIASFLYNKYKSLIFDANEN
ncbi:MAG: DUF2339 domain-containing protein, partial [Pyrinomonadaceae bacterium]